MRLCFPVAGAFPYLSQQVHLMRAALKHHRTDSNARCTHRPGILPLQPVLLWEQARQLALARLGAAQVGQVPPLVLQPPGGQALGLVLLRGAAPVLARGQPHRLRRI